ncbi:hypothetical protein PAPYR_5000 [Paratrimastix pyriformis]|uniref:Protein kinase domain-containing protein n=1 Tax=Paratrimastix pyriformis TaxID=342808 RepID=A0ABQ8UIZ3_9EUKA|nr:hypothetical protein PAPYR_5000 [Paratrimastix pyriformis]
MLCLLALFLVLLSPGDALYLGPSGTDTTDCGQSVDAPCKSLAYAITTFPNSSLVLLPGQYYGASVDAKNIKTLSLSSTDGASSTTIYCGNRARFLRVWAESVDVSGITFTGCTIAMTFENVPHVTVRDTQFVDNACQGVTFGVIVFGYDETVPLVADILLERVLFRNNVGMSGPFCVASLAPAMATPIHTITLRSCRFEGNTAWQGGAVMISDEAAQVVLEDCEFFNSFSVLSGSMDLDVREANITRCTFRNSTAKVEGGAVSFGTSVRRVTVRESVFESTTGLVGGAMHFAPGTTRVQVTDSRFLNNTAAVKGSVIRLQQCDEFLMENCTVVNAVADGTAGAILWTGDTLTVRNCTFAHTRAGTHGSAIVADASKLILIIDSDFTDTGATVEGGACRLQGGNVTLARIHFTDSFSLRGGALCINQTADTDKAGVEFRATITDCTFSHIRATEAGGAAFVYASSLDLLRSSFDDTSTSLYGGALCVSATRTHIENCSFANASSDLFGGAVLFSQAVGTVHGSQFRECRAKDGGSLWSNSELAVTGSTFTGGSAITGGGITVEGTGAAIRQCQFANTAEFGANLFVRSSAHIAVTVEDAVFDEAACTDCGSGIQCSDTPNLVLRLSNVALQGGPSLKTRGGALYILEGDFVELHNVTIAGFQASFDGGAAYVEVDRILMEGVTVTQSQSHYRSGGGLYLIPTQSAELRRVRIEGNTAAQGGAVFVGGAGTLQVSDSVFFNNTAKVKRRNVNWDNAGVLFFGTGRTLCLVIKERDFYDNFGAKTRPSSPHHSLTHTHTARSPQHGGAIAIQQAETDATFDGCSFVGNFAGGDGAGLYAKEFGSFTLTHSSCSANQCLSHGGCLSLSQGDQVDVHELEVQGDLTSVVEASVAGAIALSGIGQINMSNLVVTECEVFLEASAIRILSSKACHISNSTLARNLAPRDGALLLKGVEYISLEDLTIVDNTAGVVSALACGTDSNFTLVARRLHIEGNRVLGPVVGNGAVLVRGQSGRLSSMTLEEAEIVGNEGGGLAVSDIRLTLSNVRLGDNLTPDMPVLASNLYCASSVVNSERTTLEPLDGITWALCKDCISDLCLGGLPRPIIVEMLTSRVLYSWASDLTPVVQMRVANMTLFEPICLVADGSGVPKILNMSRFVAPDSMVCPMTIGGTTQIYVSPDVFNLGPPAQLTVISLWWVVIAPISGLVAALLLGSLIAGLVTYYRMRAWKARTARDVQALQEDLLSRQSVGLNLKGLQVMESLGAGSDGEVFRSSLHGTAVVLRRLYATTSAQGLPHFRKAVALMRKIRHPSLVLFLGSSEDPPPLLVFEYIDRGTLFALLHEATRRLDVGTRLDMALQIATGMAFLHSLRPPVVHARLTSRTVLV